MGNSKVVRDVMLGVLAADALESTARRGKGPEPSQIPFAVKPYEPNCFDEYRFCAKPEPGTGYIPKADRKARIAEVKDEAKILGGLANDFLTADKGTAQAKFDSFFGEIGKIQAKGEHFATPVFAQAEKDSSGFFSLKPTTLAAANGYHLAIEFESKFSGCSKDDSYKDGVVLPCTIVEGNFSPQGYNAFGKVNGVRFEAHSKRQNQDNGSYGLAHRSYITPRDYGE